MSYQNLEQHFTKIYHFQHLEAICSWDQQTMMPDGGQKARAEALASLGVHLHELITEPKMKEWFEQAAQAQLSPEEEASIREMQRSYDDANKLPAELVKQLSLAISNCEHAWRKQRPANDWQGFLPNFREVLRLRRQEARIRAEGTDFGPYEAMMQSYEPGMRTAQLDALFADVKTWLPELIQKASANNKDYTAPQGPFPIEQQKSLSLETMKFMGFDFQHGRLDVSHHPFCGGVPSDVRMTTRYREDSFIEALMGTVHETGHSRYEQGLPAKWGQLPVGFARSFGIHESQSLFCEMQLGQNRQFVQHLARMAQDAFGRHSDPALSPENLYAMVTQVKPGFIRVDADEVTYPAHVILRYEIEKALIDEEIEAEDLPSLWDEKMQAYLGIDTRGNYKDGCMQDVHWPEGLYGYFPSYTLGAMYAAQLMASLRSKLDVDATLAKGELGPIFAWLSENIWQKASFLSTDELITAATGETLNAAHFRRHLEQRYLG